MKTAVEWLLNEISLTTILDKEDVKLFEQANKMFEQQIIDACEKFGNLNGVDIEDYEKYYNETFKQD
jgi:hypothetical protein